MQINEKMEKESVGSGLKTQKKGAGRRKRKVKERTKREKRIWFL